MDKFYLTTTLPYVNSSPHLGFALELVQADTIIRYQKQLGKEVFFNTGTDEHGIKIFQKAQEQNKQVQQYVDEYADKFKNLMPLLGILPEIHFIRTTDKNHIKACQEFWKLVDKNGYIYKAEYKVKYCVGCELEKTESELDKEGQCLVHPHLNIEIREEENYFFKWKEFEKPLLELYAKYPDFVVPDFRFNEIKEFVKRGLKDFSISRRKEKMPWGVPVPGDEEHVMYVWFDALINYVSTLGWPENKKDFQEFWGNVVDPRAVQIAGKDNLRQQSAMWQAMLMAAGLPTSKQIVIHGFINSGGQKMSKSLGNVADPYEIISALLEKGLSKEQATEALRFYLLHDIPTFEDGDYTWEKFTESYNAFLANGIGNLTSRILKMAVNLGIKIDLSKQNINTNNTEYSFRWFMDNYRLNDAINDIWQRIRNMDQSIQTKEPFKLAKVDIVRAEAEVTILLEALYSIAYDCQMFIPVSSEKILEALNEPTLENIPKLFPRI